MDIYINILLIYDALNKYEFLLFKKDFLSENFLDNLNDLEKRRCVRLFTKPPF